jgi:hypothetical protein
MEKIYTNDRFRTIRTNVARAEELEGKLKELVSNGKIADAEWLDGEECHIQSKSFGLALQRHLSM